MAFQHVVLLKLKPGVTEDQVRAAFAAGSSLPGAIPGIERFTYGRDRSKPEHGYDIASIVQCGNEASLREYLEHPARLAYVADHVDPLTESRIELDVPTDGSHHADILSSWYWGAALEDAD
jgi:hypothetical protein